MIWKIGSRSQQNVTHQEAFETAVQIKEELNRTEFDGRVHFAKQSNFYFTITAEILARSLANFYCQYADRHMNLKFMPRVSERKPAIQQFVIVKKQIDVC